MPTSNNINWQIESIRVTAFFDGPLNPSMLETWLGEVSENSPTQISKTPTSFAGVSRSAAGFLGIKQASNRLDITLSSEEPQSSQTIAPISEANSLYGKFVDRVPEIGELPLVNRVAIGLVLTFKVQSESEGLKILSHNIVGLKLPVSVRDFLYRVNHPYESRIVDGLNINRLATWSVGKVQLIEVQFNPDGTQVQRTVSEEPWAIRLDLDFNTDQGMRLEADLERLQNLLNELKALAEKVAFDGEASMREQDLDRWT